MSQFGLMALHLNRPKAFSIKYTSTEVKTQGPKKVYVNHCLPLLGMEDTFSNHTPYTLLESLFNGMHFFSNHIMPITL